MRAQAAAGSHHSRLVPWLLYVLIFSSIEQATERENGHGSSDRLEIGFDEGGLAFFVFKGLMKNKLLGINLIARGG